LRILVEADRSGLHYFLVLFLILGAATLACGQEPLPSRDPDPEPYPEQDQEQRLGTCVDTSTASCNANCTYRYLGRNLPPREGGQRYTICMASNVVNQPNFSILQGGITHMVSTWNNFASQNENAPRFQLEIGQSGECKIQIRMDPNLTDADAR
jgi:hypothetical protein